MKDSGVVVIHIPDKIDCRLVQNPEKNEVTGKNERMFKVVFHEFEYQLIEGEKGELVLRYLGWTKKRGKSWAAWWKTVQQ